MLRWGILTAGNISRQFATAFSCLPLEDHVLVGVAARDHENALKFAKEFGITAYKSYEEMVMDPDIDVVYIGAINTRHLPLGKLALENGKHVLCEKPLCINVRETMELIQVATRSERFLMEAVWSRFFPSYKRLTEEIQRKSIGDVMEVHSSFGVNYVKKNRVMSRNLGGGGILDIGVYNVQMALLVFPGLEPSQIESTGTLTSDGVDATNTSVLTFEGGKKATLVTDTTEDLCNEVIIVGTKGKMKVVRPFWRSTSLVLGDESVVDFPQPTDKEGNFNKSMGLSYQCLEVKRCIDAGLLESSVMSHAESIRIAEIMEKMRKDMGVTYEQDNHAAVGDSITTPPLTYRELFFTRTMTASDDLSEASAMIKRRFPGPAGLLPKLENKESKINQTQLTHPLSEQFSKIISTDLRSASKGTGQGLGLTCSEIMSNRDREILKISQAGWEMLVNELGLYTDAVKHLLVEMNVAWIKKKVAGKFPITVKIPFLALVVYEGPEIHAARSSLPQSERKNQSVTMMDVTGTIVAAVDASLLPYMVPGSALAVQNIRLLTTPKNRYVAIVLTKKNIICIAALVKNLPPVEDEATHDVQLIKFTDFKPEDLQKQYQELCLSRAPVRRTHGCGDVPLVPNADPSIEGLPSDNDDSFSLMTDDEDNEGWSKQVDLLENAIFSDQEDL